MVIGLERKGLIHRTPRVARSIRVLLEDAAIPALQSIPTSGTPNWPACITTDPCSEEVPSILRPLKHIEDAELKDRVS